MAIEKPSRHSVMQVNLISEKSCRQHGAPDVMRRAVLLCGRLTQTHNLNLIMRKTSDKTTLRDILQNNRYLQNAPQNCEVWNRGKREQLSQTREIEDI